MSQAHSNLHRSAWADWWEGTRRTDIWLTLAWFDIVLRYRRSMLGPLWITLSMGAMIGGMGPLYSSLFGNYESFDLEAYEEDADGMQWHGNVSVGPYSVLVFSQDA